MKRTGLISVISCLLLLTAILPAAEGDAALDAAIENPWRTDTDKALMELKNKPKIILLSADWCHWCKQLQKDSATNETAKNILQQLPGITVDVDKHPELMAYFGLQGIPALLLVNAKEEVVDLRAGYQTPGKLNTLLTQWLTQKDAAGKMPSGLYPEMEYDMLKEQGGMQAVLREMGKGTSSQRIYLRERLAQEKNIDAQLWPLLTHPSLSVRIDASRVLELRHGSFNAYDAFATGADRQSGARKWQDSAGSTEKKPVDKQPTTAPDHQSDPAGQ